mmetsp:Transcript_29892/g.87276  ORF Transcript_29892/g.87276 Transcript_29892/m.87276 type:complete len:283 (-) Transcript_29892:2521-3369(-)
MVVITSRSTGCSLRRLLLLGICVRLEQGCRLLLLAGLVPGARFSQVPLPCSRSLLSPILLVSSPRIVGQDSSFQHRLHRAVEEEESLLHRSKTIDDKTSASSGMRRLLAATALVVRLVLGVVAEPNGVAVVLALLLEFTGTVFVRAALEVDIGVRQGQRDRVRPGLLNLVDEIIDGTDSSNDEGTITLTGRVSSRRDDEASFGIEQLALRLLSENIGADFGDLVDHEDVAGGLVRPGQDDLELAEATRELRLRVRDRVAGLLYGSGDLGGSSGGLGGIDGIA